MTTVSERLPDGHLVLDQPVILPDVLDLLIVGGGPAGTACAFRAKELNLSALVIEMDDLMKRIRDYASDKPILPDYGGGDTMQFPAGGPLLADLRFRRIDKDAMVREWKALYRKHGIPAQVGMELLKLERQPDGVWRADTRNHFTKEYRSLQARNVVLGLGRGVPRRLDIPGNVQDLAYRLSDASQLVGGPACVIGGGTSAAEAVIAISNAKAQHAEDETPVYWSYHGKFMPKVSQALAPELFDVLMLNGNVRFAWNCEAVSIVARDAQEYLTFRMKVDHPGRSQEDVHLEFAKRFCIACIGADRPDSLLKTLGVEFVPNESGEGDRVVVTPLLQARQAGLFVAGDLLSPDYAEADSFDDPPTAFRIRPRRGNIKTALRDGVRVAEAVRQRVDGKQNIVVSVRDAPPLENEVPQPAGTVSAPAPSETSSPGRLVSILLDGTPADEFPLVANGATTIGRRETTVAFPDDSMLSDRHASITHGPAGLELRDSGSPNGVFLKIPEGRDVALPPGTIVKAGRQWLVCGEADRAGNVAHYDSAGRPVDRYSVPDNGTLVLGRRRPAVVLNPDDSSLSRRHLSLSLDAGRMVLRDLGSRNGTFVKVDRPWPLADGDLIWLGNQLLRLVTGDGHEPAPAVSRGKTEPPPRQVPPTSPAAVAAGDASVTFGPGKTFPFGRSSNLLEMALAKRVRIKFDCKVGDCGKCRVEVTAGADFLDPRTPQEEKALRMTGHDEPHSRLACLVKTVRGPVAVEVPK